MRTCFSIVTRANSIALWVLNIVALFGLGLALVNPLIDSASALKIAFAFAFMSSLTLLFITLVNIKKHAHIPSFFTVAWTLLTLVMAGHWLMALDYVTYSELKILVCQWITLWCDGIVIALYG